MKIENKTSLPVQLVSNPNRKNRVDIKLISRAETAKRLNY
jgi:hypothetical protein